MNKSAKILLGTSIGLFLLGVVFIIVSTATLYSDNELNCLFLNGPCLGLIIPQDSDFCCPLTIYEATCYAKFYCNGDTFTVNGLRYMGIGSVVVGIITLIAFCCKNKKNPAGYQQFAN